MAKQYWISKSRYLQQVGEDQPHYVEATPHNPVLVTLPDDIKADRGLRAVEEKPEKPSTGFVKRQSVTTKTPTAKQTGKRAADQ